MSGKRPPVEGREGATGAQRASGNAVPQELLRDLLRLKFRTKHLVSDQLQGAYTSIFRGQGLSFSEVRGYQPGDDVRWIDWNVSARMSDAFVKVFVEERELTVMIVVDLSQSTAFGTRRAAKAWVAACWEVSGSAPWTYTATATVRPKCSGCPATARCRRSSSHRGMGEQPTEPKGCSKGELASCRCRCR